MPVKEPYGQVDPTKPENHGIPLWCVYGPDCFPSVLLCRIKRSDYDGSVNIWGHSVWKRQPGFRTLGISLKEFMERQQVTRFFASQGDAMMHLIDITTNRVKS